MHVCQVFHVSLDNIKEGETVEYDNDGCWIRGTITKIEELSNSCSISLAGSKVTKQVPHSKLRLPVSWCENEWKCEHDTSRAVQEKKDGNGCRNGFNSGRISSIDLEIGGLDEVSRASLSLNESFHLESQCKPEKMLEAEVMEDNSTDVIAIDCEDHTTASPYPFDAKDPIAVAEKYSIESGYVAGQQAHPEEESGSKRNVRNSL